MPATIDCYAFAGNQWFINEENNKKITYSLQPIAFKVFSTTVITVDGWLHLCCWQSWILQVIRTISTIILIKWTHAFLIPHYCWLTSLDSSAYVQPIRYSATVQCYCCHTTLNHTVRYLNRDVGFVESPLLPSGRLSLNPSQGYAPNSSCLIRHASVLMINYMRKHKKFVKFNQLTNLTRSA